METRGERFLLLLVVAFVVGCHDDGPTSPTGVPPSAATPTPVPVANLTGTWTGTISEQGSFDETLCPGRSASVTVLVVQIGNDVNFGVQSPRLCTDAGPLHFQGTVSGSSVSGQVQKESVFAGAPCVLTGRLSGELTPSRIHLQGPLSGCRARLASGIDLAR